MDGFQNSVMLGLLPMTTEWSKLEIPHLTLVYVGEKPDLKPTTFNELAKDAASIAMLSNTISLKVMGQDVFGGDGEDKVDVLKLRPSPELLAMRRTVESWNGSQHPFTPHVTVGPIGSYAEKFSSIIDVPSSLAFDRICVGWGDEYLTFWLKR